MRRRKLGPPSSTWSYELSERGRDLEPVLTALGQWGSRIPISTNQDLGTDALIFALTTTFDADIAGHLKAVVELHVGADRFRAEVGHGHFRVARGNADKADATVITDSSTLQSLVFAGQPLAKAEAAGKATIVGDRRAAEHLLRCFPPSVQREPTADVVYGRDRRAGRHVR